MDRKRYPCMGCQAMTTDERALRRIEFWIAFWANLVLIAHTDEVIFRLVWLGFALFWLVGNVILRKP